MNPYWIALHAIEDRNRTAGQEFRGFAGHGSHGRLSERVSDALSLEGLQRGAEVLAPLEPVQSALGSGYDAVDGERVVEREASVWPAAIQVHAKLLEDLAPNLGDCHPQADLVGPADCQGVDHFSRGAVGLAVGAARGAASSAARDGDRRAWSSGRRRIIDKAVRDIERLLRLLGRCD
jgi:hypothetical protein